MENQPELHIDRSFEQTAEHTHGDGQVCLTCIAHTFPEHLRRPFDRHVSPAILEQRILDLEAERDLLETAYKRELSRRKEAETRVRYIEKRIKHFEGLVSVLSRYIDKLAVTAAQVQRTAKFATDFAGQLKGGQPLPFEFPAEETDETRKRA